MDIIVSVIKECMRDVYLNLPIFPSEEGYKTSSLESGVSGGSVSGVSGVSVGESDVGVVSGVSGVSVGESDVGFEIDQDLLRLKEERYRIRSKVIDGKRWFLCPFETCEKKFRSQRTADAYINSHLGLLYRCKKCEFVSHNYDSCRNHKCFAYAGVERGSRRQHLRRGRGKR